MCSNMDNNYYFTVCLSLFSAGHCFGGGFGDSGGSSDDFSDFWCSEGDAGSARVIKKTPHVSHIGW